MKLILRNTTYYIRKRVPKRFALVEPRKIVWVSLHTDSERTAAVKASAAWAEMNEAWEARLAGYSDDAELRFEAARELAQARGFRYLPAKRVADLPKEALLERIEAIRVTEGGPDLLEAGALLEPPLVYRRAFGSNVRLLFDVGSRFHRTSPLLHAA